MVGCRRILCGLWVECVARIYLRRSEIENSLKLCNSCCSRSLRVALGVGEKVRPLSSNWISAGDSWYVLKLCNARLVVWVASPGIKNALVAFSFS